jgi:hypothetical protein
MTVYTIMVTNHKNCTPGIAGKNSFVNTAPGYYKKQIARQKMIGYLGVQDNGVLNLPPCSQSSCQSSQS